MLCTINRIQKLRDFACVIELNIPGIGALSKPGQFLHIKCGDGLLLRRPVSICTALGDTAAIAFEIKGKGTLWLSERRVGEALDALGPLGNGFPDFDGRILVVGGGIGVPPLLGLAERTDADAVLGFKSADRIIFMQQFTGLCRSACLCTDDGSAGFHGFVDAAARDALERESYAAVCACGPVPMLKAVAAVAEQYGTPCYVSMEQRMGCGVGACLVCSCKTSSGYSRVCKDGPVFNASEVVFDG